MQTLPHRYVRHRDPESLVKAFMGRRKRYKDVFGEEYTYEGWLSAVRKHGYWAFVRIWKGKGTIHWYAHDRISDRRLAHMLGHELGHITGRQDKDRVMEEWRADAYGDVALEVTEMLRTRRRRAPKARRRGTTSARSNRRASARRAR